MKILWNNFIKSDVRHLAEVKKKRLLFDRVHTSSENYNEKKKHLENRGM